jgi:drug/metabolite transporter (DMT)-like permease
MALIVLSVSLFGFVDGISKVLAETQSLGQIVLARYVMAIPILMACTPIAKWSSLLRTSQPGLQVMRALTSLLIGGSMVLAVRNLPIADATAILFAGPFVVVALSPGLLGERVGLGSWIGVIVGFLAVLIVVRPGLGALSRYTVFPLAAAISYAFFQLLTRRLGASGEDPNTTLAWALAAGLTAGLPFALLTWVPANIMAWLLMIALGLIFGSAQALMAYAFVWAPANVLAPFSYAQIVAATLFGLAVFGAVPDYPTAIGIIMIICTGIYVARGTAR